MDDRNDELSVDPEHTARTYHCNVLQGRSQDFSKGGLIQHALMPLCSSLRSHTPQGTRGVGRNLLRGFPVDPACCEAAPPRIAWKFFGISQRSDFEKRYNKPIMLGTLASYRLFL